MKSFVTIFLMAHCSEKHIQWTMYHTIYWSKAPFTFLTKKSFTFDVFLDFLAKENVHLRFGVQKSPVF